MYSNEWKHFCRHFFSFASTSYYLIVFLFCLHFCLVSYFEKIRCIVKLLTATSTYFCWNTAEKRKLEKCFLGARAWAPKPYIGLPNSLNKSLPLVATALLVGSYVDFPSIAIQSYPLVRNKKSKLKVQSEISNVLCFLGRPTL